MGQYRQWLHYRERDRALRVQLKALEEELNQLQAQRIHVHSAEQTALATNAIMIALASYQEQTDEAERTVSSPPGGQDVFSDSISSALQAWSSLPSSETPFTSDTVIPQTPLPHLETTLLPENMTMFIDEHSATLPQIATPWWLRNILAHPNTRLAAGSIDQQNPRTNRLVQRWVARWGQQIEPTAQQEWQRSGDTQGDVEE